jgi:hypothetical protein
MLMYRPIVLLVLIACGAPADAAPEWGAPPARHQVTFAPADDELRALMLAADAAWTLAGVHPDVLVVLEPGPPVGGAVPVEWRTTTEISAKCMPNGGRAIGCTDMAGEGLLFSSDAIGSKLALIASHETGHALRLATEDWHPRCGSVGDAVMCDGSRADALTTVDSDFICASATKPCD